jgi:uncharacterized membrane protein
MIQGRLKQILAAYRENSSVDIIAVPLLILACLVSILGAFVYLAGSSFWLDELDSIFGATGSLRDVFEKAVRYDTFPPLYEYCLHFWIAAFGDSETSARLPSAIAAALVVPAWYWATRPVLSLWASLLLPAMCVTTLFWFDQSQQARAYSLAQLDLALLFGFFVRAACAAANRGAFSNSICMIIISGIAAFIHLYAFMISGVLIVTALLLVKERRAQWALFVGGSVILGLMLLFIFVRQSVSELHVEEMWFANNWKSLNVWLSYPTAFAGSSAGAVVIVFAIGTAVLGLWSRRHTLRKEIVSSPRLKLAFAAMVVPVVVSGTVIIIALAGMPTLTARNASLIAPFFWVAVIASADWGHAIAPSWFVNANKLFSSILMLLASGIVAYRPLSQREDWRSAGHAVVARAGCAGSTVYVTNADTFAAMLKISPAVYGHYAPGVMFKVIGKNQIFRPTMIKTLAEKSYDIAMGRVQCPVVLWSAHAFSEDEVIRIKAAISKVLQTKPVVLKLESFPHWKIRSMHQPELVSEVFLLLSYRLDGPNQIVR